MQRVSLLVCCALFPLACDPPGDEPDAIEIADDDADEELVLAGAVAQDDAPQRPDVDASLGAEIPPQGTWTCTVYGGTVYTSGGGGSNEGDDKGCSGGFTGVGLPGAFLPDLETPATESAYALMVSQCAVSGHTLQLNGKPRCTNLCNSVGKQWVKQVDYGMCPGNAEYTIHPLEIDTTSCPVGKARARQTADLDAQCGCQCSP